MLDHILLSILLAVAVMMGAAALTGNPATGMLAGLISLSVFLLMPIRQRK